MLGTEGGDGSKKQTKTNMGPKSDGKQHTKRCKTLIKISAASHKEPRLGHVS